MSRKLPTCQINGCHKQATLAYKLDPRNWHERRALLCPDHRTKLGYTKVTHERAARAGTKVPQRGKSTT